MFFRLLLRRIRFRLFSRIRIFVFFFLLAALFFSLSSGCFSLIPNALTVFIAFFRGHAEIVAGYFINRSVGGIKNQTDVFAYQFRKHQLIVRDHLQVRDRREDQISVLHDQFEHVLIIAFRPRQNLGDLFKNFPVEIFRILLKLRADRLHGFIGEIRKQRNMNQVFHIGLIVDGN